MTGNVSHQEFKGSTISGIKSGKLVHHLLIDYWQTKAQSTLKVSNIRAYAGGAFKSMCGAASPE